MKIQFYGNNSFLLETPKNMVCFNPKEETKKEADFAMFSKKQDRVVVKSKKILELPGEFEISGILAKGFFTDDRSNVVYKVVLEEIAVVHFGDLKNIPGTSLFEALGESIDIAIILLSADFDHKKAKELIEKLDPRMVIFGGDMTFYPKIMENLGAKVAESNPINITRSNFSDEKTELLIMNA